MSALRSSVKPPCKHQVQWIAGSAVQLPSGWRRVFSAWALVVILAGGGFAVVELAPSLGLAKATPELHGVKIPQYDPFSLGLSPFEGAEAELEARRAFME